MKSIRILGKSIPLFVMVLLLVGLASGALLTYYGRITGMVTVEQAVLLDGQPDSIITESISGVGCDKLKGGEHYLTNKNPNTKIVVDLVSTEMVEVATYPEYKLNAIAQATNIDDDAFYVKLSDNVVWGSFTGISFDYLIEGDGETKWIPQTNIVLRDSEGNAKYYVSWNSFRTGITGTAGTRNSITQLKGDFYVYSIPDWGLLGLYENLNDGQKSELDTLYFNYFVIQAGDTSYPNNVQPDGVANEIVWVSNIATNKDVTGIGLMTPDSDPVQQNTEFRMLYDIDCEAPNGTYIIDTGIKFKDII